MRVDVTVLGAGIVGVCTALHLQERGADVALVDRSAPGETAALAPDLHAAAVTLAARGGDTAQFDRLLAAAEAEKDPAFRRRYLIGLAAFEDPALAARALTMTLGEHVPLQELAFYVAGLIVNPVVRDDAWALLQARWADVLAKTTGAPTILRRIIESLGMLPERRHLDAVRAFLAAHPVDSAKQAIAQTLERMEQDVALRERLRDDLSAWISAR